MTNETLLKIAIGLISFAATGFTSLLIFYLRGIKINFERMRKPVAEMQKSLAKLNTQIAVVIADRQNDKEEIGRLREDFIEHKKFCARVATKGSK